MVTVLFADLVGFTARAEALDPEDVVAIQRPYFDGARRELQRHGGTLEKYIGDAVVALFGAPVAHEDDPERAVRAALAIRDAIQDLNEGDEWLDLSIRVGVNTGEALINLSARPDRGEGMAAGDAINTAARIQTAAPVNTVLVGELTYKATRDVIEYRVADPIAAKGKSDRVPVWEALRAAELRQRRRSDESALKGRGADLERLLGLWGFVGRERLPGLAFVTGLPGIGKTRLIEEFARRIEDEADVHWGQCLPYGEGITYWPVMEIVKSVAGILQSDDTGVIGSKLDAMLEGFSIDALDERRTMAAAVSNLLGVPTTPRGTSQAVQLTQAELHWGIRRVLQCVARERPLSLVVEDLHWAEPTLIEFVQFLVEDEIGVPLLVLVSARPEAEEAVPGLVRERARARTLRLQPLSGKAAEALLRELLGSEKLAASPAAATLLRATGGNPLFLEETVRALRDAGMVDDEGWHLPDETAELPTPTSLQSLIVSRLDQLAPPVKQIAQYASVVGAVFWPGAIAHMQGDGGGVSGDLIEHLRILERRDFVREHETSTVAGECEFAFKHILIRDAAYGQLPKGRRIELHMRFAEWIQALPTTDEFIEIVAWHLEHASLLAREVARSPVEAPVREAVVALSGAAEKAERREGLREADGFYARALELVGEDDEAAMELGIRRAGVLIGLGKAREGLELLKPIAEAARAAGRLDLACEALGHLASIDHRQGGRGSLERFDEVLKLAVQVGDRKLQVRAAFALASGKGDRGAANEALEELGRAISIAEEIEDRPLRVVGHLRAGFLLYNKGELAAAEEQLERCSSLAAELSSSRDEARATFLLALIRYYRGELEEAERLGEQARAWLERTGETYFQTQNLIALSQYALAGNDLPRAEQHLRQALPIALQEGALEAVDIYRLMTETLVRQGRLADASELAEFAGRDVPAENRYASAALRLAEACVAVAQRDLARATERYEEAIALLEQLDLRIELGQARLAYGRALRELGDLVRAREQLELARDASVQMGATGLAAEVERELALIRGSCL